jgi:hypothetical protein
VYPAIQEQFVITLVPDLEFDIKGHARQSEREVLAEFDAYVSSGQSMQLALPVIFLYVPGGHAEQFNSGSPVYPRSQSQ